MNHRRIVLLKFFNAVSSIYIYTRLCCGDSNLWMVCMPTWSCEFCCIFEIPSPCPPSYKQSTSSSHKREWVHSYCCFYHRAKAKYVQGKPRFESIAEGRSSTFQIETNGVRWVLQSGTTAESAGSHIQGDRGVLKTTLWSPFSLFFSSQCWRKGLQMNTIGICWVVLTYVATMSGEFRHSKLKFLTTTQLKLLIANYRQWSASAEASVVEPALYAYRASSTPITSNRRDLNMWNACMPKWNVSFVAFFEILSPCLPFYDQSTFLWHKREWVHLSFHFYHRARADYVTM